MKKLSMVLVLGTLFSLICSVIHAQTFDSFHDNPAYRDKFIGKWTDTKDISSGHYISYEFRNDGTCIYNAYENNRIRYTNRSRYKTSDLQIVFLYEDNSQGIRNYIFTDNNTLSMKYSTGESFTIYRSGVVQNESNSVSGQIPSVVVSDFTSRARDIHADDLDTVTEMFMTSLHLVKR